jgi:carbon monoxide dehydrogenase subunit G
MTQRRHIQSVRPVLVAVAALALIATSAVAVAGQAPTQATVDNAAAGPLADTDDRVEGALTVTNVTVSREQPTAGDTFEVQLTVRNHEGAGVQVDLNEISLNGPDEERVVNDVGTLPAGASTTVTFPVTIDQPGQYSLNAKARGIAPGAGFATANRPIPVQVVADRGPQVNIIAPELETGLESTADVTVVSGNYQSVESLDLRVDGEHIRVQNPRRVRTALSAEANASYDFDLVPTTSGPTDLTATLTYTTPGGERRTATSTRTMVVEEPDRQVSLTASGGTVGPSARTTLQVTVANEGDRSVSGLQFQVDGRDIRLVDPQRVAAALPAGNETTYTIEARDVDPGSHRVTVTGAYETAGGTHREFDRSMTATVTEQQNPGRVNLTGLRISPGANGLAVRGTASNGGATNVTGVTVQVGQSASVAPAQSQSSFFVGEIEAGDFSSFDVTAVPRTNGSVTVPLEVSYAVDGVERQRIITVDYRPPARPQPASTQQGGNTPLVLVGGGLLLVGGVVTVAWRRIRG